MLTSLVFVTGVRHVWSGVLTACSRGVRQSATSPEYPRCRRVVKVGPTTGSLSFSDMALTSLRPVRRDELRRVWPVDPRRSALVVGAFVALLWVVQVVNSADRGRLVPEAGIIPLSPHGLDGILFAPVLHAGWLHLEGNTVPVAVLAFLATSAGLLRFGAATAVIWLVAGVGTWVFGGAGTVHVGASSLVFGWLTLLLVRGLVARSVGQVVLAVVLFAVYGSVLWSVLPVTYGVSWQGHLFGALGGVLAALLVSRPLVAGRGRPALPRG